MALTQTVQDNFDDNSINATLWPGGITSSTTVAETGGQAVFTLANGIAGGNYATYDTTPNTYDLTNSYIVVKVPTVPSSSTNAQAYIKLALDATNFVVLGKQLTNLYQQRQLAGVDSTTNVVYNSYFHLWWRLSTQGSNVLWETSPNGYQWTVQRSLAPGFAVTAVQVSFGAGTFQSETSPGTAVFDNFNIIPSTPNALIFNKLRPYAFSPGLAR